MRPVVLSRPRGAADDHPRHEPGRIRRDPFAELVRQVAGDPDNPFNIERYLWVLEEAAPEPCGHCGVLFVPSFDYDGAPARGQARRYCTAACAQRATWGRRTLRWGSAA